VQRSLLDPDAKAAQRLARHEEGSCKPCIHAAKGTPDACPYQDACKFCHFEHTYLWKAKRPSKARRDRYRKQSARIVAQAVTNPEGFDVESMELPTYIAKNRWLTAKLKKRINHFVEETARPTGEKTDFLMDAMSTTTDCSVAEGFSRSTCNVKIEEGGLTEDTGGSSTGCDAEESLSTCSFETMGEGETEQNTGLRDVDEAL